MPSCQSWDIYCTVVDNFGDIGVCWRLARQLHAEFARSVRLWVDDLESFRRINPAINPALSVQSSHGVEVRHWHPPLPDVEPADVVIEAFACDLPQQVIDAMARQAHKPLWINLEYLSAEDWVEGCHALASPHPHLPLVKYFFFPGFTPKTGGLLAARELPVKRAAFQHDPTAQAAFWEALRLPQPRTGELTVSLFGYGKSDLTGLFGAWAALDTPVRCLAFEGPTWPEIAAWFEAPALQPGQVLQQGALTVCPMGFVEQEQYDRLLWACDLNFVRGEDSFVRAQWAARPFVWHIYPQDDNAHWVKLEAFLKIYCAGLPADAATALRRFWEAWNRGSGVTAAWPAFHRQLAVFQAHARDWAAHLAANGDLASNLVDFCRRIR